MEEEKEPLPDAGDALEKLTSKVAELTEKWKRAAADYANLERRTAADREGWIKFANSQLLRRFLPLLDSLEKALENHPENPGLKAMARQFAAVLSEERVEEIIAKDQPFDPRFHECLEVVKGEEDDKVVAVLREGYKIGEKVLRPAQVKVSKIKPEGESEQAEREGMLAGDYL